MKTVTLTESRMTAEHEYVWKQIESLELDEPDAPYPFSKRLAKEKNWTPEFADRVIREYRKFLFLLYAAGRMVTPSKYVDEVWHLHLIYTHSYWEVMCMQIFKRPVHHHPGNGSDEDNQKYAAIYQRTLDDYACVFGEPPVDIWGCRNPLLDWSVILSRLPVGRATRTELMELFASPHSVQRNQ